MLKRDELTKGCISKAYDDEMVFVLLGRDPAASQTIRDWVDERLYQGLNERDDPQIKEALQCAEYIDQHCKEWRERRDRDRDQSIAQHCGCKPSGCPDFCPGYEHKQKEVK